MSHLTDFSIPFKGLKQGKHELEFEITDRFFADFEESEITKGKLVANVILEKTSTFLKLDVHIVGEVEVACDRCLELFNAKVDTNGTLYVRFSERETNESEDDDMIFLLPSETEFEIKQPLYDWICLSLPVQRVHPNGKKGKPTCNPEMLKRLQELTVTEETISAESEETDDWKKKLSELKSNISDN